MNLHLDGHPISASTYRRWRCRCPGCRAANTQALREYRQRHPERRRAQQNRALARQRKAWAWIKTNRPDIATQIELELTHD